MTAKQLTPSVQAIMQNLNDLELMRLQAENYTLKRRLGAAEELARRMMEAGNLGDPEDMKLAHEVLNGGQ